MLLTNSYRQEIPDIAYDKKHKNKMDELEDASKSTQVAIWNELSNIKSQNKSIVDTTKKLNQSAKELNSEVTQDLISVESSINNGIEKISESVKKFKKLDQIGESSFYKEKNARDKKLTDLKNNELSLLDCQKRLDDIKFYTNENANIDVRIIELSLASESLYWTAFK